VLPRLQWRCYLAFRYNSGTNSKQWLLTTRLASSSGSPAKYYAWACLYSRYWLFHLFIIGNSRNLSWRSTQEGHLASIQKGIWHEVDWLQGTDSIFWFTVGISRWHSWLWIQQRHLASTWLGITKGIDYVQGTDYIFWLTVGISRWHSWLWIQQRHLASTWLGITLGSNYIQGADYIVWWIIGYLGWISRLWITKGTWHQFK
jgi:hypothetical protein